MNAKAIKTKKVIVGDQLFPILDSAITSLREGSIVAVTSKIVSITEGAIIAVTTDEDKYALIEKEAQFYLPPHLSKYNVTLTIKDNTLAAAAGIDESNGNGFYVLLPKDPQKSANQIRAYLRAKFGVKKLGVIITDSKTTVLKWGTSGFSIAHSGFEALKNYINTPDVFGRYLKMTKANIADSLAVTAVLMMGEGSEQTPLAIIEDVHFVKFQDKNPTKQELADLKIELEDDLYAPLLKGVKWQKGKP